MLATYLKRGAYNTFAYGSSLLFARILAFLFLPYFLSKLTLEEFGTWDYYQTLFSLGSMILSTSTATGLTRYYWFNKEDKLKQQQSIGNALAFTLICASLFFIVALGALHLIKPTKLNATYTIGLLNIPLFSFFSLALAYCRAKEHLWSYFFLNVAQNTMATLLTAVAIEYGLGINGFFYANGLSYLIFFPCYLFLLYQNFSFSLPLLKEQLTYSVPILLHGVLYCLFFTVDRFIIKTYCGLEALGIYGLLYRFGNIFRFFSMALSTALPVVLFNAQKEQNGSQLITRLFNFFILTLASANIGILICSHVAINFMFPQKYLHIAAYLPFFFLTLIFLETARFLQSGIELSQKTIFSPIITAITLGLQLLCLILLQPFGLWGIFSANIIVFILFTLFNYQATVKLNTKTLIDSSTLLKIALPTICCIVGLHTLIFYNAPWYTLLTLPITWALLQWRLVIKDDEKALFINKVRSLMHQLQTPKTTTPAIKIRNDHYYQPKNTPNKQKQN